MLSHDLCIHWDRKMHQVVANKKWKTVTTKLWGQKVVAFAYERWSFTRGSSYRAATGKILMFCISGHLWEVVAYELHMEV